MADTLSIRITAPVELSDCKVVTMSDGARYLVSKTDESRICLAYGFDGARADWRSKSSFFKKPGEEGFWLAFDKRTVVDVLD